MIKSKNIHNIPTPHTRRHEREPPPSPDDVAPLATMRLRERERWGCLVLIATDFVATRLGVYGGADLG
jgi:hypothetical protein